MDTQLRLDQCNITHHPYTTIMSRRTTSATYQLTHETEHNWHHSQPWAKMPHARTHARNTTA